MIKIVLSDVDGVLTDGKMWINSIGDSFKCLNYKDIDAVSLLRSKGIKFGVVTAEENHFTTTIKQKMHPDFFFSGCKDKYQCILAIARKEEISLDEICYVGDGKYDIEPISKVGLGVCPNDAIDEVKIIADIVLKSKGGEGCLAEIYTMLSIEQKEGPI